MRFRRREGKGGRGQRGWDAGEGRVKERTVKVEIEGSKEEGANRGKEA